LDSGCGLSDFGWSFSEDVVNRGGPSALPVPL
jgi:hypothetical protein